MKRPFFAMLLAMAIFASVAIAQDPAAGGQRGPGGGARGDVERQLLPQQALLQTWSQSLPMRSTNRMRPHYKKW